MSKQNNNTPRLRFPEFTGEWVEKTLGDSFKERTEKNREDLPLLSLGENGLAYQSETMRKDNSNADKSKYLRVALGDIAYNTMRMWQGRCVFVDKEGIVSPAYTVCQPREGIDSMFHYYLFKTHNMIGKFHQNSQGLVNDTLNLKFEAFSKIKYFLPPTLAEQQKIAECLMAIDGQISVQSQKVEALKEKKKGMMQQLFPQNGETTPRLRFPGFTGEWVEKKLRDITNNEDNRRRPISKTERKSGEYPYYGANGIQDYVDDYIFDGDYLLVGEDGSVLTKENTPVINWASGKFWVNNHAHVLSQKGDTSLKLISYVLSMVKIDGRVTGIPPKLNQDNLNSILVYIPHSPDEQQKIADCLSELDSLIAAETAQLESLKEHKKGLMQQLFPQPAK